MNNLIAESIKDLEFILTEWEGDTNALLGAVRVNARLDRITPILTAIAEKTREDTIIEVRKTIARSLGYLENSDLDPSPERVITESELFEIFYKLSDKESK